MSNAPCSDLSASAARSSLRVLTSSLRKTLCRWYSTVRGLITYGGGMGELDVGRGQIQLLAALFHPDGPNDTAPSGYNADTPAPDLPPSPLPASPAATGFRREA